MAATLRSFRRGGARFVQARFAAVGSVAMDNAALGRFIDGRDEGAFGFLIFRAGVARERFVHLPQTREDAAITEGAQNGLASAFAGGFGIGHEEIFWAWRLAERRAFVNRRKRSGWRFVG